MVRTDEAVVVLCTAPDDEVASKLARGLVEAKLAACVSRIPALRSTYVWNDEIVEDTEVQLVIKTHRDRLDALERFVSENHPYEVPELIALPVVAGGARYLAFVSEATRSS